MANDIFLWRNVLDWNIDCSFEQSHCLVGWNYSRISYRLTQNVSIVGVFYFSYEIQIIFYLKLYYVLCINTAKVYLF